MSILSYAGRCFLALTAFVAATSASATSRSCEGLGDGTKIGAATVVLAQDVPAGDYTGADGAKLKGLPSFCRLLAVASPRPTSQILIEVWLPSDGSWNGKLLGTGNGGAGGRLQTAALAGGLRRGFATANTDLGSAPAAQPGVGFSFGDGRPEAIRDWASRATHEMTLLAKELVGRFYGRLATKAYFVGCSTGGHQALMEAQRFPDDYDGIIAGAPAHNRTHLHVRFAALRQLGNAPGAALPPAITKAWTAAILKSCAGRDGGAPGDVFLTNPLACTIMPKDLACGSAESENGCLSAAQVSALTSVYGGTRNPRTGEMIYFADVRGAEQTLGLVYGEGYFSKNFDITHWTLPLERRSLSFDFDRDMAAMDDALAADINAMNPDLSRFAARGGRLILFHGWEDGLISPLDSLDYFDRIKAQDRNREAFARLFMVPGMSHCNGGTGVVRFGQAPDEEAGVEATSDGDLLMALDRWSTGGIAPERILAAYRAPVGASDGVRKGRPICAYPALPRYVGQGDPLLPTSFRCAKSASVRYERPAAQYLR